MPHFVNDGLSLHYEVHGSGRPVVLLHGGTVSFAGNFAAWGWIERLTAQGLQVIGLDFRGHGRSDKPHDTELYGTAALSRDVIALIDHLGIDRASLVGYSIGSAVALHLLHACPGRFGRSVLVATGDGLIGLPPYTFSAVLPCLVAALRQPEFPKDLPSHVAAYWTFATEVGGDRAAAAAAASASYPPCSIEAAASIEVPVLVVSGERDPVLGRGPRLAQALSQGHYVEIAGADHFMLARDEKVQAAVADFLAASP
ncbi:MAG: alpha/beta fold hydrolase [Burkholderiales bacterium]